MELIRFGHACVRLQSEGRVLVIDPGIFSEASSLDGGTDVLVTHEHVDHVVPTMLAGRGLNVYGPATVIEQLAAEGVEGTAVTAGDTFEAAGFSVTAVGGEHAEIHPAIPRIANIGYIVDGDVYHPGDSFFVPELPVVTLLLPVAAPWLKIGEAIDFVRAIKPARAYPIHDAILSEQGVALVDRLIGQLGETDYQRIPVRGGVMW